VRRQGHTTRSRGSAGRGPETPGSGDLVRTGPEPRAAKVDLMRVDGQERLRPNLVQNTVRDTATPSPLCLASCRSGNELNSSWPGATASVAGGRSAQSRCGQRADSSFRLNVHFHTLALDSAYVRDDAGVLRFHTLPELSLEQVAIVARWTQNDSSACASVMAVRPTTSTSSPSTSPGTRCLLRHVGQ
jgi:hypothetical protein